MDVAELSTGEAEVVSIITTFAETRLMSPRDIKEEEKYNSFNKYHYGN